MKKLLILACSACMVYPLIGCAPAIVGGAAVATGVTVSTATDRRSAGAVLNDTVLESRVESEIKTAVKEKFGKNLDYNITVTAYNGRVLITGEIATQEAKDLATETARASLDVKSVINELAVMQSVGFWQGMSDSSLATKVRTRMIGTEDVFLSQMKVTVSRGIVYLMGIVTPQEKDIAMNVAARTSGVYKVISVCETMSAERIAERMKMIQQENKAAQEEQN